MDRPIIAVVIFLLCMISLALFVGINDGCPFEDSYTEEYRLYQVVAPFGIFYADTGGWFLSLSTSLGEEYIIKYMDGDLLKTLHVDAETGKAIINHRYVNVYMHNSTDCKVVYSYTHKYGRFLGNFVGISLDRVDVYVLLPQVSEEGTLIDSTRL